MGNSSLIRREAEMTHLQPHLGDSRSQELRSSPFGLLLSSRLNWLRTEKSCSLKKAPLKTLKVLDPIKTSPSVVPTIRKEVPTGSAHMGDNPLQAVTNCFPQVGGNQITEAPEVVFDLTQGDEGMETPSPNDSLKASLSPPVGGRLRSFRRDWQTNKCSNNVLEIITNGYILPFNTNPLIHSGYKAHQKDLPLASCVQSLLSKNTIERVENVKSLGFYSCLFLVPKPHQRWRPVIDLSRLNTFHKSREI